MHHGTRKVCCRKDDRAIARYISGSNESLRRYGHSKLYKMAAGRHLGFNVNRNSAIRSADHENPTLEPNMKCIGSPVADIWPFAYLGPLGHMEPHFGEGAVVGDQRLHHSKQYCDHCDRCAICNHSPAICDRMCPTLKSTGVGHFGPKFGGVPLEYTPDVWVCRERTPYRLTKRDIIFEEFQPM